MNFVTVYVGTTGTQHRPLKISPGASTAAIVGVYQAEKPTCSTSVLNQSNRQNSVRFRLRRRNKLNLSYYQFNSRLGLGQSTGNQVSIKSKPRGSRQQVVIFLQDTSLL